MTQQTDRLNTALAGRYRIERHLGEGGMATVYLCEDIKHKRKVALKLLKPELAAVLGAERFVQEITTTAALQHPHILPLFDSGTADGFLFYVMPYIQGETLREKLNREAQLGVDEAVRIARDVADALDYAHRNGVIHRDIKPENILLHDGRPMVADFGIALAVSAAAGGRMTETGLSLGTPHYMSPEQATAEKEITARSDVYSVGSVLYEMLTGNPPFTGAIAQQIIMKIITEPAEPVTKYRKSVPHNVAAAVAKSLEKLPADRFESAKAFAEALGNTAYTNLRGTADAPAARSRRRLAGAVAAVAAGIVVIGGARWLFGHRGAGESTGVVRLSISVPPEAAFANIYAGPPIAISPDGMTIVYTARTMSGPQLALRRLDELKPRVLAGTVAGIYPFFVNDGTALGFSDGAQYFRVALDGAPPTPASPTQVGAGNGAAGLPGGGFVVGASGGILIARAFGDSLFPLTKPDTAAGDLNHRFPVAVDENTLLFASYGPKASRIGIASLKDGSFTLLDLPGVTPLGMIDDYLVYVRSDGQYDGLVSAVKVGLSRRRVLGEPVTTERGVAVHGNGSVQAALSQSGTLVYSSGSTMSRMVAVDMRGVSRPLYPEALRLASPRYSPDGRHIVVNRTDESSELWVYDVGSKVPKRLTSDGLTNDRPEWSADGRRVAYRSGLRSYWWQRADGTDKPALLLGAMSTASSAAQVAMVPDGKRFIARIPFPGTGMDLMLATIGDTMSVTPFVATRFNEYMPTVSRDGKWVAYISSEAGPLDVYVRALDGSSSRIPVSSGGGMEPRWAPDGRHLYYRANRTLVAASVTTVPGFAVTARDTLFQDVYATDPFHTNYDIAPDGKHFVMLQPIDNSQQAIVVLNFAKEVRAKMAAAKR